MKHLLMVVAATMIAHQLLAQSISIVERKVNNKDLQVNAWVIPVGNDFDLARRTFIDFSRKELKLKPKSEGKMTVISRAASLPAVSSKRGDFEGILFSEGNSYMMGIAFAFGYDIVINSMDYPEEMNALRDVAIDYLKYHYSRHFDRSLERIERERSKLQKESRHTEKEIGSLRAANKRNEKKIYKTEDPAAELEYQTRIDQNNLKIDNLNLKLPDLRHRIEKKTEEIDEVKAEYNDVMAQIRALRTATTS